MDDLKKTCLYDNHVALKAQMSPFGGFMMPIQYSSIIDEHNAVRQRVGMFDVSHMGEIFVTGDDAERFVNHIFTNDVTALPAGKILYGMMLYPDGGVVDDLLVYKMAEPKTWLLVVNAANIEKDERWVLRQAEGYDLSVELLSGEMAEIAVQGPKAEELLCSLLEKPEPGSALFKAAVAIDAITPILLLLLAVIALIGNSYNPFIYFRF